MFPIYEDLCLIPFIIYEKLVPGKLRKFNLFWSATAVSLQRKPVSLTHVIKKNPL